MTGLTTALLGKACRIFLALAYPEGCLAPAKQAYFNVRPDQPLEPLLAPPLCQVLPAPQGGVRGYAFRLGCGTFPHMKLRVVDCGGNLVFAVDTHDAMSLAPSHPDAGRWAEMQVANRRLKQEIERAWEQEGLKTFNELLRDGLEGCRE
jgi:hypothetical protein